MKVLSLPFTSIPSYASKLKSKSEAMIRIKSDKLKEVRKLNFSPTKGHVIDVMA